MSTCRKADLLFYKQLMTDCTETAGAVIFYTLNGEKPAPFQTIGPAAKATFMYQEPFTLPGGKHTIKAVAISEYVNIYSLSIAQACYF